MAATPEQFRRFLSGEITQDELLGETPKVSATKAKIERKRSKRDEDQIQSQGLAWFNSKWPDIPVYGNATANIFFSGGMYRKALPKSVYGTIKAMGINASTWGYLIDHALSKMGLRLTVATLEKEQEGAKFAQMKRTKELGAVSSWPDIQICTARTVRYMDDNGQWQFRLMHGLFAELKKPDASSLPWGKSDNGKWTTNDHLQSQAKTLSSLVKEGHCAAFAVGLEQFKTLVEIYMGCHQGQSYLQEQRIKLEGEDFHRMIYRIRMQP